MVQQENIDSGYSSFQLDTRSSGSRRGLAYLLIRRRLNRLPAPMRYSVSVLWGTDGGQTRPHGYGAP
jgi:hypothetical protein